ncbi:unnamed protein product [Didymodactylos carnosus]|uniref:Fringe-like glycosyltransferase domain-containing protein n=1 Tax=Didymodactylos carnosus TaxID=1234261 RepID=A0A814VAC1_9BILA|nr:unnamed protein product [Didymodactylos carnosus]CAF1270865.1 unnamed protein product [Didymodactylos carnosus]CAF3948501.1 unnamed protein product [Didymodactylos carnosus]CAF4076300.1 unnamed protein product [Didymodactylos carnosus]
MSTSSPISQRTLILIRTSHHCESRLKYLLSSWIPSTEIEQREKNLYLLTDQYVHNSISYQKFVNIIETGCPKKHRKYDLCCKTASEFELYYNLTLIIKLSFDWMCRFDDDHYINLDNLYLYLNKLDASKPYYIGRTTYDNQKESYFYNVTFRFATYGAGVCYSKQLLNQLKFYVNKTAFSNNCIKLGVNDDVYMGYLIQLKLNVSLTPINDLIHSHYEQLDASFRRFTLQQLINSITLGFSWDRYQLKWMPVIHKLIYLSKTTQEHTAIMTVWNFIRDYEKLHSEDLVNKYDDSCTSYQTKIKTETKTKQQLLSTRI